MKIEE
jgi:hypothetical protein